MKQELKLYQRILYWIGCHEIVFYILSWTWGFLASFIGIIIMIPFLITKKTKTFYGRLYGIFPKCFGSGWGFEMGCFFFVSHDCPNDLHMNSHEAGHGLQNVLWGPLMLFVISIPSVIRFWYHVSLLKKGKQPKQYDSIWFEGQATKWGWDYIYLSHINKNARKDSHEKNK